MICATFYLAPAQPSLVHAGQDLSSDKPSAAWNELVARLKKDGLYANDIENALKSMTEGPSPLPMSRKIKELYTKYYLSPPKEEKPSPEKPRPRVYKDTITSDTIKKCRHYLTTYKATFAAAEKKYGVPKEIAVALLFVETRLGEFLGREKAFVTLAGMAASRTKEHVTEILAELPVSEEHYPWLDELLIKRSDWAYKELVALIVNLRAANLHLLDVPGSIYGAFGLCQFMPSNVEHYGADGNGDKRVNLFETPDAIFSLSNYLKENGWKAKLNQAGQHKVLKRYNFSDVYANTILELAKAIKKR